MSFLIFFIRATIEKVNEACRYFQFPLKVKNVTFLNRKWISPRKLIPDQGKVYPRAVFTPRGSALQPRAKRGL